MLISTMILAKKKHMTIQQIKIILCIIFSILLVSTCFCTNAFASEETTAETTAETTEETTEENMTIEEQVTEVREMLLYITTILILFVIVFFFKSMYKFFAMFF